jgi:hypothetical protein
MAQSAGEGKAMRRAARTDANQTAIVEALRAVGSSVLSLAAIGKGCPDLLVCRQDKLYLLEVKDGSKPPSERKLRDNQKAWHVAWCGTVYVVESVEQALAVVLDAPPVTR